MALDSVLPCTQGQHWRQFSTAQWVKCKDFPAKGVKFNILKIWKCDELILDVENKQALITLQGMAE